jgi:hypothetical protein
MNRIAILCAAGILAWANAAYAQAGGVKTFRGEVSDSQCALNVHSLTRSHEEMLKSKSMGGTSRSCSQYCIEHLGGELVLSSSGATVFRLDNQGAARGYAGQRVKVVGTLDPKSKTIHMVSIVPETQPPSR